MTLAFGMKLQSCLTDAPEKLTEMMSNRWKLHEISFFVAREIKECLKL